MMQYFFLLQLDCHQRCCHAITNNIFTIILSLPLCWHTKTTTTITIIITVIIFIHTLYPLSSASLMSPLNTICVFSLFLLTYLQLSFILSTKFPLNQTSEIIHVIYAHGIRQPAYLCRSRHEVRYTSIKSWLPVLRHKYIVIYSSYPCKTEISGWFWNMSVWSTSFLLFT